MSKELLNDLLESRGVKTTKQAPKKAVLKEERIKESDILYKEIDSLVEGAMREDLSKVVMENFKGDDLVKSLHIVETSSFTQEQTMGYIEETIDPIIETMNTINTPKIMKLKNKNRIKGIALPVYEVALTLESARAGALTMESLDDVCVKEEVDPNAQEFEDVINSSIDQTYDMGENKEGMDVNTEPDSRMYDLKSGDVKPADAHVMKEVSDSELMDPDQHLDNRMWKIASDGGGSEPSQAERHSDEVNFTSDSDIESYVGQPAGDGDDNLFNTVEENRVEESTVIGRLLNRLNEMMDQEENMDVEPKDNATDTSLKTFTGVPAGEEGPGATASNELNAEGTSDEAIVEQQTILAKALIGRIFSEYGITEKGIQRAIVREAIHYIFKHGINALHPSVSDVAHLVTEQNKLKDAGGVHSSKAIVESTKPILTKNHKKQIVEKSVEMLTAIKNSKTLTESVDNSPAAVEPNSYARKKIPSNEKIKYANMVMEAVSNIHRASEIERTRQAFRYRMNKFSEAAKNSVASKWIAKDNNLSESATSLKNGMTIRKYITEAPEMKEYFNVLKENSPIYTNIFRKKVLDNDTLVTAAVMTEVATLWTSIKNNFYNKKPYGVKYGALTTMIETTKGYKNLFSAMRNPSAAKNVMENFAYRLQALKDKVGYRLKQTK